MYWKRDITSLLHRALDQFPAVLITGPRQSGKTTLLRRELDGIADYVTFDDPLERQFALDDPRGFLDRFGKRQIILDEVQYVPGLFSYLKMMIDDDRTNGRFIMTGSQQFHLMKNIGDSLAGRVAILELLPFGKNEIMSDIASSIKDLIWYGGYPPVLVAPEARDLWIKSYLQTYVERDIRQLQQIKDLRLFEMYITLCAASHGQVLNHARLAGKCGISQPTSKEWQSLLEASYVIFHLQPFYNNYGKRLVKSGKIFFLDSSLAAYLTRQPEPESLWAGPMGGAFFEGWVIGETVKFFTSRGEKPPISFWRSHDGLEVDMLVECNGRIHSAEIKQTATPMPRHSAPLVKLKKLIGDDMSGNQAILCMVRESQSMPDGVKAIPWSSLGTWLAECAG